jgi:hypothetical protein
MNSIKNTCKAVLLCATTLLTINAHATMPIQSMYSPSDLGDYVLHPNEPQPFMNFMRWVVSIKCFVRDTDEHEPASIALKLMRKKATLNDIALSAGDTLVFTVEPEEDFLVTAQPGAKVMLTNTGEEDITAHCDAVSDIFS